MSYLRDITADDRVFYDTDRILRYTIYEADSTDEAIAAGTAVPLDVSGWSLAWQLRKKAKDLDALIDKNTGSPGGIAIVGIFNADPDVNTQRIEVTIEDTDTYDPDVDPVVNLKPGSYVYALKRTDPGAEDILAFGSFTLLQAAAWE